MFWDKKKKETGLPDLPSLPPTIPLILREPPQVEDEFDKEAIQKLPPLPDSSMQRGFSQTAIKEAVAQEEMYAALPEFKEPKQDYKTIEMKEWSPQSAQQTKQRESAPIFVRLDKFQLARNSLETVKTKLAEIETLLKQIRDTKIKEDAELSAWEKDMTNIKERIEGVLNGLFEKTDY